MSFSEAMLDKHSSLWSTMLEHPFLVETRDGELSEETFNTWLKQDYLFVKAAIPFIGQLISKGPDAHRRALGDIIPALNDELELFEERASTLGVDVTDVEPGFTNHAYIQHLKSTGGTSSYEEAFTVYYAAEKAYHESWKVVGEGLDEDSQWYPFVENWAGEEFGQLVNYLESEVNQLAKNSSPKVKKKMERRFTETTKYEIAFWEMAYNGPEWPGTEWGS